MAQGCFWGCSGPLGTVHMGLQTPQPWDYCTICRVSKYIHTNFQLLIFKNEDYIAQWYSQGCLEPPRGCSGPLGVVCKGHQTPLSMGLYSHTICRVSTVADEEGPVKPMPILWYQEMFAESSRPFCGLISYQKIAHCNGKQKEANREK